MRFAMLIGLLILVCGCIGQQHKYEMTYYCWEGTIVNDTDNCPTTTTTTEEPSTTTIEAPTTSVADLTSTTMPPTTQTATTTTFTLCGNGKIDFDEQCDPGSVCAHGEGVCRILPGPSPLAVCMVGGACDFNTQSGATKPYNMGKCGGCWGKNSNKACTCISQEAYGKTAGITSGTLFNMSSTTILPVGLFNNFHTECQMGLCTNVRGNGTNQCITDVECTHKECLKGKCVEVAGAGKDKCKKDHLDCWHYECGGGGTYEIIDGPGQDSTGC